MAPKRKAAPKPKKNEPIAIEDMPNVTVRRPMKNNESKDQKDEEQDVIPSKVYFLEKNMNAKVMIEKMPTDFINAHLPKVESEEVVEVEDPVKKAILKKNVSTKVTKPELKKQTFEDGKESKKTRKRAASEDRQTNKMEEKVVSVKGKKKPVDKDLSEPSDSKSNEPQKRNRRAASVDILTKNSSSALEPKKLRKANKATIGTTGDLTKRHRRSSSLDIVSPESLTVVPKKNSKTVDDKPKKNTKVVKKKEPKINEKNKKGGKYTIKVLIDKKDNVNLQSLEPNVTAEDIEDNVKPTKEQFDENLEIEEDSLKVPNQINSKSRGKRQAIQKHNSKSKQNKSSEEPFEKTDTDDSDNMSKTPEEKLNLNEKEQADENLEIENNSEEILKQINNKKKGKKQAVQKHTSKSKQDNSSEDTCDGKTDSDDSHLSKTLEVKQKLNENEHGDEPTDEQNLKLVEDNSEKIPKQINSKSRGKGLAVQKHISKPNKSPEKSNLKSNTDDSDMTNSPEIKPKRVGKGKQANVDQEIKLPKRQVRKVKPDYFEGKVTSDNDEKVKTVDILDNLPNSPESERNLVPTKVKRKTKAKPAKK